MLDDDKLEGAVRNLIIDICEVMYRNGYESVPVGAIMRLVGVGEERAQNHDHEHFALDHDFVVILENRKNPPPRSAPADATLH